MINGFKLSTKNDRCEKDMNPDQEIITINKSKFIDDISKLLEVIFIFGVSIGASIMLLIFVLVNIF